MIKELDIIKKLKEVQDPELGIDIYTLGLIYKITTNDEGIEVLMTLTSPLCPFANDIVVAVEEKLRELGNDIDIKVEITFDPQWEPSDELRLLLGV